MNILQYKPEHQIEHASFKVSEKASELIKKFHKSSDGLTLRNWKALSEILDFAAAAEQTIAEQNQYISNLESIAATDMLTGLLNRQGFENEISTAIARAQRYGEKSLFAFIDLDGFKLINDTYGHFKGDDYISGFASCIKNNSTYNSISARIGGDEFILVFEGLTERDRLSQMAARLIRALERPVMYGTVACCISGSVGIALRHRGDDGLPDALIAAADGALYGAKAAGRGCYRFASDSFVHGSEKSLEKGVDPPGRPE